MYWVGRILQMIGLGVSGIGCLIAFDPDTPERDFWSYALIGMVIFFVGHFLMPKR